MLTAGGTDYYSEPSIPGTDKGVIELEGIRNTRVFLPRTNNWVQADSMNHGRWYPALVTLGNGQVFVASAGYVVLTPTARGFGDSDGLVTLGGPNEINDLKTMIAGIQSTVRVRRFVKPAPRAPSRAPPRRPRAAARGPQ